MEVTFGCNLAQKQPKSLFLCLPVWLIRRFLHLYRKQNDRNNIKLYRDNDACAVVWSITSTAAASRLASDTRLQPAAEAYNIISIPSYIGRDRIFTCQIYLYIPYDAYRGYASKFMINVYHIYTSYTPAFRRYPFSDYAEKQRYICVHT